MLRRIAPFALVVMTACSVQPEPVRDHHDDGPIGTVESALEPGDSVSLAVTSSCTTSSVRGLATQLIDEIQCIRPGTFASIETDPGFKLESAVFPWLQTPAREALLAAQKDRGATMTINSALRTLPQQFLLYRWYKTGRCGIGLAAAPGNSNHESALAVDIDDNAAWRTAMKAHDFVWLGSGDPVHFDYKGAGAVDIGGLSVLAFQRLWNRNHPEDVIDEDSDYGSATEERVAKSPVGGFAKGADCSAPKPDASVPPIDQGDGGGSSSGLLGTKGSRTDDDPGCDCAVGREGRSSRGWAALMALAIAMVVRGMRSSNRTRRKD